MSIGRGIAVAGIWIGVGIVGFASTPFAVAVVAICAVYATLVVT